VAAWLVYPWHIVILGRAAQPCTTDSEIVHQLCPSMSCLALSLLKVTYYDAKDVLKATKSAPVSVHFLRAADIEVT